MGFKLFGCNYCGSASNGYVFGGSTTNEMVRYQPGSDAWDTRAPCSVNRLRCWGGKPSSVNHFTHGQDNVTQFSGRVDAYVDDVWSTKTSDSVGTRGHTAQGENAYLYSAYGATASLSYTTATRRYDEGGNSWSGMTAASAPAREQLASFLIASKMYCACGVYGAAGEVQSDDLSEYDIAGNSWSTKTAFTGGGRQLVTGFALGSLGYIDGGYDPTASPTAKNDLTEYDPSGDAWTARMANGTTRSSSASFVLDAGLSANIAGGVNDAVILDLHNNYTPDAWVTKQSMISARYAHCPAVI